MPAQGGGSMATPLGRLHLVTDCRPGRDPVAVVRAGLSVGVPVVQVRVAAAVDVPVIAIGAVTAERIPALLDAGAYGVAVVSAVSGAADPASACARLLAALPVGDRG